MQLRDRPPGHRALPGERLRAAGGGRLRHPADQRQDPDLRGARPAPDPQGGGLEQARPGDRRRRHRFGQIHHARHHGRVPQRQDARAYRHHRGPGRIRAHPQGLRDHAPRGRRRHRLLALRAQEHPASGARCDPDRGDPRPRDHGVRHPVLRDRAPGAGHAARQQRQSGARPRRQLLPRRAPRPAAHGPVAEHPRAGVAAADPARVGRRAHRGDGDHAQLAAHPGPDLQGRSRQDQGSDVALDAPRHEDLRPGAVRAVRDRPHLLRGRAAQRRLEERAAPARQAREQARAQGGRRRRRARVTPPSTPSRCSS